jgi:flagellar biosynthesis GTPase FlhF
VKQFSAAHVHLVLNAAYESAQLLAQTRAFAALPVTDLIVTHLDEETRWGKLWNLVLGTDYPIRYLAAGQNIPGGFTEASAEHLLARHFPVK